VFLQKNAEVFERKRDALRSGGARMTKREELEIAGGEVRRTAERRGMEERRLWEMGIRELKPL
jgi:hypothetical protein